MEPNQMRDMLEKLERELQNLATRLEGAIASAPDSDSLGLAEGDRGKDLFDQVQATETRESHFASRDRIVDRMHRVSAAIRRVRAGTYGECVECGNPIAPARLRAIPEVTTCVTCQEKLEQLGRWKDARDGAGVLDLVPDERAGGYRGRPDLEGPQSAADILESLRETAVHEGESDRAPGPQPAVARSNGRGAHQHERITAASARSRRAGTRAARARTRTAEAVNG
jgi:DnaK suppressor protein